MKRIGIVITVFLTVFILTNCQKEIIETTKKSEKKVEARTSRISFVKSAKVSTDDNQQPFQLLYVNKQSKTEMAFLVEYKTGDEFKLHNFDVAWDEKLEIDKDGKLWMNLKVYHKTIEENAKNIMRDSAAVNIPDISTYGNDTISKLWLRFINTTDAKNVLTLQYVKTEKSKTKEDNNTTQDSTSTTTQDSTTTGNEGDSGTTTQDSTGNSTGNNSGTTTQDSTGTNSGDNSGTTVQDSTANEYDNTTQGSTTQDSTTTGNEGDSGTTTQDSTGNSTGNNSGTTTQDSTGTNSGDNSGTTVQDSTASNN